MTRLNSFRPLGLLGAAILVSLAGCSDARRQRERPREAPPAPAPSTAAGPPPTAPARPAPAAAAQQPTSPLVESTVAGAITREAATGDAALTLSLATPRKLGGFALTLTWDPRLFVLGGDPHAEPSLTGYMCQPNVQVAGTLRYNCVGIVEGLRGGLLATVPVRFKDRAPRVEDFTIVQDKFVDDMGQAIPDARLALAIQPGGHAATP